MYIVGLVYITVYYSKQKYEEHWSWRCKHKMSGEEEFQDAWRWTQVVKMCGERKWRVGGEDEEEWKEVVQMNMSYDMHCVLKNKVYY